MVGVGSDLATSITSGPGISHRKKGDCAPPEADGTARCAVVCRCHAPAAISAAAGGLGAGRSASSGARHRTECQTRAVWSPQPTHRASHRAALVERDRPRRPGLLDRTPPTLPRGSDHLAVAGPRTGAYRCADPALG